MVSKTWTKTAKYPPPVATTPHWEEGDIAFLRSSNTFSPEDRRALTNPTREFPGGYIHVRATSHPVIILRRLSRGSTHVLITTVSAYGSGPENDYLAPWNQDRHYGKARVDFRSFAGSERPTPQFPPLFLRSGEAMRKPHASWVYIQRAWVVPTTVLGRFDSVTGADVVGLTPDSLNDLRTHMAARCRAWPSCQRRLLAVEPTCSPGASAVPAGLAVAPAVASASASAAVAAAAPAAVPAVVAPSAASAPAAPPDAGQLPPSPRPTPAARHPAPTAVRTWAAVAGKSGQPKSAAPPPSPPSRLVLKKKGREADKDKGKGKGKEP